jgi:RND family efflux transporter MFP subunit
MDLAVTDADRTKPLFENGSISAAQWDETRTRAEQAKAQYDAALNGARQAWAALLGAQSQAGLAQKAVADTAIRAPFDGGIAEKRISEGEYANPGRVVMVVVRDRPLRLRIDVPEVDSAKVAVGREVTLTVAAYPGRVFKGKIARVGASLASQSRSLPVEAEIANDDGALKPGFFAHASIDLGGADETTLLVPRAAIGSSGSASRVFVRSGNRVVERIVTLGREIDGLVEIHGALTPNDEIATDSLDALSDGAEIQVAS